MSIKLQNITNKNLDDLIDIVSNLDVMKYVGSRKTWNKKRLPFINNCSLRF